MYYFVLVTIRSTLGETSILSILYKQYIGSYDSYSVNKYVKHVVITFDKRSSMNYKLN